jgi:hypothetical protein
VIVVDTGPIVAATFRDDKNHERCVKEFTRLHNADRPLLVPSFIAPATRVDRCGGAGLVWSPARITCAPGQGRKAAAWSVAQVV